MGLSRWRGWVKLGNMEGLRVGDYQLASLIWRGKSTVVYRARRSDGEEFALKTIHEHAPDPRVTAREMDKEARIASQLYHPYIVRTFEIFYADEKPWVVMEYFPSRNLRQLILTKDPIICEKAKEIMIACAEALSYLHSQNLLHLDVKPENVLVADTGETKLVDFALALEKIPLLQRIFPSIRRIAGTRSYIAPETIAKRSIDRRTDIYSYGATFYEMLTGRPVFSSDDRERILTMHLIEPPSSMRIYNRELSEEIDALILQMLEKAPDKRPPDMKTVIARLEKIPIYESSE